MPEDIPFSALLGPFGLLAFLLYVVVWGGRKGWWVFGRELDACKEDVRFWKDLAMRSLNVSEKTVHAAEKLAPEQSIEEMARLVDRARREGKDV